MEMFFNFKWAFIALIICFIVYFVYDYLRLKLATNKDIHFKDKDAEITQKIIEYKNKYPDVDLSYILKPENEKSIDNNQEIHEIIEILKEHKARIEELENKH